MYRINPEFDRQYIPEDESEGESTVERIARNVALAAAVAIAGLAIVKTYVASKERDQEPIKEKARQSDTFDEKGIDQQSFMHAPLTERKIALLESDNWEETLEGFVDTLRDEEILELLKFIHNPTQQELDIYYATPNDNPQTPFEKSCWKYIDSKHAISDTHEE